MPRIPRWSVLLLALLACTGKPTTDGPDDSAGDSGKHSGSSDTCPVALVSPDALRWDEVPPGEGGEQALSLLNNCDGEQALSVLAEVDAPFAVTGSPVSLEPGGVATLGVSFDGAADAVGTLLLTTNDPDQGSITIPLTATVDTDLDDDGHDAAEDCDDTDPDVYPGAPETWYDGVDQDCSGGSDFDQDGDGFDLGAGPGDDCDDGNATVNPDAVEDWYDGVDQDCDGRDDDRDEDGYGHDEDCDDLDAERNPGAVDTPYDGVDQDCDGEDATDRDGDGWAPPQDCDDGDAEVNPDATEAWYDGVDQDCSGGSDFDQDGDGFDRGSDPGEDCDDTDADVNPDATEVWYDGADQDCDGGSDFDQDGDGYELGTDCDDTDPAVGGGTTEIRNGLDDDCDGRVDEDLAVAGDIVVTEVMANPSAVSDTAGEWFEIYNTSAYEVDLAGWLLYSDDGGSVTLTGPVVAPGAYAVLGVSADTASNGGVTLDATYDRTVFGLADAGDSIYLVQGSTTITELSWTSTWPNEEGASLNLDNDHVDAGAYNTRTYWCAASSAFGAGDRGTPGAENDECALDDDRDRYTAGDDCDDDDRAVYPGATERANGIDDDCDGYVDDDWVAIGDAPLVFGDSSDQLYAAGAGDFDGDGEIELVVADNNSNRWYLLSGVDYADWGGGVTAYDEASFTYSSSGDYPAGAPRGIGDLTGDGVDDFAYALQTTYTGFAIYAGPITGTGTNVSPDDGFSEAWYGGDASVTAGGDLDGDGVSELIYANTLSEHMDPYGGMVAVFQGGIFGGSTDLSDAVVILNGETSYGMIGTDVAVGDADGDGYDDLAIAASADEDFLWLSDGLRRRDTYVGDVASVSVYGSQTADLELWDADGDGAMDLLTVDGDNFELYLGIGSATGTLTVPDLVYLPNSGGGGLTCSLPHAWLDTDADGATEPAIYAYSPSLGGGASAFFPSAGFADGAWDGGDAGWAVGAEDIGVSRLIAADLDGDGDTELVASSSSYSSSRGGLTVIER